MERLSVILFPRIPQADQPQVFPRAPPSPKQRNGTATSPIRADPPTPSPPAANRTGSSSRKSLPKPSERGHLRHLNLPGSDPCQARTEYQHPHPHPQRPLPSSSPARPPPPPPLPPPPPPPPPPANPPRPSRANPPP